MQGKHLHKTVKAVYLGTHLRK